MDRWDGRRVTMAPARSWLTRRICQTSFTSEDDGAAVLARVQGLGFDSVLIPSILPGDGDPGLISSDDRALGGSEAASVLRLQADAAKAASVRLLVDLTMHRFAVTHALVEANPDAFSNRPAGDEEAPVDPRRPISLAGEARPCLEDAAAAELIGEFIAKALRDLATAGLQGVRVLQPQAAGPNFWRRLIDEVREVSPGFVFIADGQGVAREAMLALAGCGFDAVTSSLPFWDGRARWLIEEHQALRIVAPLLAATDAPSSVSGTSLHYHQRLRLAAATGAGLLASLPPPDAVEPEAALREAIGLSRKLDRFDGELRVLTGEGAPVTGLLLADASDVRRAAAALLILLNPDGTDPAAPEPHALLAASGGEFEPFARIDGGEEAFAALMPGEVRLLLARRGRAVVQPLAVGPASAEAAAIAPRLVVEAVTPAVEGGAFPVRRVVGERVEVEADVFGDGHEQLAVELLWRPLDGAEWRAAPMVELGNDRWRAGFVLERLGRYEFAVEAWLDVYGGFRRDFRKKLEAGVAQSLDVMEGVDLVRLASERSGHPLESALKALSARLIAAPDDRARGDVLLEGATADLMRQADERPHTLRSPVQIVDAERLQARFASWYELFPRSQSGDAARHGTFDDVIARLPQVRAMGFDVLYFPPIHPIGRKNRKGRNNTLTPTDDDVGSPYAIGSAEGGHDAIHAELGSLEDFRRLVAAAAAHGLEIALDFAVQCSPDHPWLKHHPGWFDWRPDGSIKYAENPPKKYQDIVNVDFYKPEATPDLWLALRDIVLLWVAEGVKLFRVDNPHTKPLPFWEWMIADVRSAHPDVVFLAEAFTRPKVMYRLAKIGFSQSYTYFTWRHTKAEFIEYLTELTTTAPREFFRPHFFVNTPDINPPFLQTSGRSGFLIRAALATTLSGLWGVYSGFELCEFEPLPGREEYKDSEKYEIRPRPPRAPGDIVAEITRLNVIRKGHPALQTHLGVSFLPSGNDKVLVYAKATASLDDVVVVAVSLDPHHPQETGFELPLWSWGLGDDALVKVEDLVWESRFTWRGKAQHVRLEPGQPYAIWSPRVPVKLILAEDL